MLTGMKLMRIIDPPHAVVRTKFAVTLTEEERATLTGLLGRGQAAARTLAHARVLLKADAAPGGPAWTDERIGEALAVSLKTIARIRRTFVDEGLQAALHRRPPRTSRPRKLDGRAEAHLVALQCSPPPKGYERWTLQLLTDRFVELGVSPPVSDETVRRVLKQTTSNRG
jgi:transposase